MKCEDFDKLIHLYFDGELDAGKSKEIEEHLLTCQECATRLQELEGLDQAAKRIRMPEVSPDYWKTFAERVRNEIILRRRKSIWAKIKSGWESFFFYSPVKLRIAAGIASILLVFIIGKLYWNYKGKELQKISTPRVEKVLAPQVQKKAESSVPAKKEPVQAKKQVQKLVLPESTKASSAQKPREMPATQVQDVLKTQVGFVVRNQEAHVRGGRAGEVNYVIAPPEPESTGTAKSEPLPETTLYVLKSSEEKSAGKMMVSKSVQLEKAQVEQSPAETLRYYKTDNNWIRALSDKDTSVEADTLRKVVDSWEYYFVNKTASQWPPEGFAQVKYAYQLLFIKTKSQSVLQQGIESLNKYRDAAVDPKVKDQLVKAIAELEALKKK